jgi:hypothetical protein
LEERVEVTENEEEEVSSYWIALRKQQEIEGGRTRSHSVENSFWKRVWTCPRTDSRMNEGHLSHVVLRNDPAADFWVPTFVIHIHLTICKTAKSPEQYKKYTCTIKCKFPVVGSV